MTDAPLRRANLEVSLKPFTAYDRDSLLATVGTIFDQWSTLLAAADECSVLLWVSDGSEILDWRSEIDEEIEWARWIGFNNTEASPYGEPKEPERVAIPFRDGMPTVTYRDLAALVATIKRVGAERGLPTSVGATFDPGPEFAPSSFKFDRHPEVVARGEDIGIGPIIAMVRHFSELRGDDRRYAAFPGGIPDGTSFGEFLGRQAQDYLAVLDFDYLWLSNGFGFSSYAWSELGESFDGTRFRADRVEELRTRALGFWRDLGRHLSYPVQVRGTNHTAGIDIGADAVPALEIYEAGVIESPPPNSPWGPLNEDFGIEMAGFMSRIAMLPAGAEGYRFRFYANDPWFWQQPWWDFYHREPFDIDLPLAVSRVRADGSVQPPTEVNVLAIDTAKGVLDERCAREVGDHVATALEAAPDAPGPLVWVYPFREYHERMAADPSTIGSPHFEDWYLTSAINAGLPLNTVVPTDDLAGALGSGSMAESILVAPAGALTSAMAGLLESHASRGGTVLLYGSLARSEAARAMVGLDLAREGIDGDLRLATALAGDATTTDVLPTTLRHDPLLSDGPAREVARDPGVEVLATVAAEDRERVYASSRAVGRGRVLWVRGSSPFAYAEPDDRGVRAHVPHDREEFVDAGALARDLVATTGFRVSHELRRPSSGRAVLAAHRSAGALWFSGYLPDTTTRVRLALPGGAPVLHHQECWLEDGVATYQFAKSVRAECRALVRQSSAGRLSCREMAPFPAHMTRGFRVTGLVDASVTLLLPPHVAELRVLVDGEPLTLDDQPGGRLTVGPVTGTLTTMWQETKDTGGETT
ncbi:hypothetical protein [Tessaracoccus oleiagri]|uniref:Uncharacterized protein n=1 Tax=Tessaracoccus oleiagri TaxID=686624 RepID=A0A1G9KKF8_9ACTN|nr:hypothetical protein [Tessaracoccus oleiagri]SDL50096.1 hypothetical protein SAMN04488242_1686 [Tessaracoccus oleiagri]